MRQKSQFESKAQ